MVTCSHFVQTVKKNVTFSCKHKNLPSDCFAPGARTRFRWSIPPKAFHQMFPTGHLDCALLSTLLSSSEQLKYKYKRYQNPSSDRLRNTDEIRIWICLYFHFQPHSPVNFHFFSFRDCSSVPSECNVVDQVAKGSFECKIKAFKLYLLIISNTESECNVKNGGL